MVTVRSVGKRIGRVMERITRPSRTSAYGSLLLGRVTENPAQRRVRIQSILTSFIITVNVIGIAVMILLVTVAFPEPSVFTEAPVWLPTVVAPAYLLLALVLGTWWLTTRTIKDLRWSIEDRPPSQEDQRNVFFTPWRITLSHLLLWGGAAVLFTTLYGLYDTEFIPKLGLVLPLCGVLVATSCYLFAEFALRPVAALALTAGPPPHRLGAGVMGRTLIIWMISAGLPLIGIGLVALFSLLMRNLTQHQLEIAVLIASALSLVVGFLLMWILAWLTATPLRAMRAALKQVEDGDLDTQVVVFDGTELGELQRGFNSMVAGLRERERVRDLFGRHVGRDVAAAAEQQRPTLGGEERYVAVVFVDIIGSTKLVSRLPAREVVELLNRFFAVVVEEVDRHSGLVNKFEGDATLAIFGAPAPLDNPQDHALAATRSIARRLYKEVPECPARIGVASGEVVAGNVGARERFEYTVIGGPVNEAARLSEVARTERYRVVASAATVAAACGAEQRLWRTGKAVRLRGHDQRVTIASLIDAPS